MREWISIFLFLGLTSVMAMDELRFQSAEKQTTLLELYTSEGCSSCPPAEAWLSKLKSDPGLWKDFVPLAFHVDYWDRLGWRDQFASRAWTERQNNYTSLLHSDSVYTPEFIRNGEEWRDWFHDRQLAKTDAKNAGSLSATTTDNKSFSIAYRGGDNSKLEAHIALLGCGISSKIAGGENNGRQLQHDFVALDHKSILMKTEGTTAHATLVIESGSKSAPQKAVAIWITQENQLKPLQATGGWLANVALRK